MLKKAAAGETVPYWTEMPAPIITAAEVDKYYKMLDDAEAMMKARRRPRRRRGRSTTGFSR